MTANLLSPKKRHKARNFAVQALYQWQLTGDDISEIMLQFLVDMNTNKCDSDYFRQALLGVAQNIAVIEQHFTPHLVERSLAELDPIERAVLRLGTYELAFCPEIPYKVVMNEAIELTKHFGAEGSYKYINAVLDKTAAVLRSAESR